MGNRQIIWLDTSDTVAAAQILAWIARPHRPESAIRVLNHWYWTNHRKAGGEMPQMPFELEKPGRIAGPFWRLQSECLTAFRSGAWLQTLILKDSSHHWFNSFDHGVSALATGRVGFDNRGNEIARVWSKRKPVAHMCLAAANAIGQLHRESDWVGFGLAGTMLRPTWVPEAIKQSEDWAHTVSRLSSPWPTFQFQRA